MAGDEPRYAVPAAGRVVAEMSTVLVWLAGFSLVIGAVLALSMAVSSVWEKERRAAWFSLGTLVVLLIPFTALLVLDRRGVFDHGTGLVLLTAAALFGGTALVLFTVPTGSNPRALQGTAGSIVGAVARYDEREQVFARNRALRPGSEEYEYFYDTHPQYQRFDDRRRTRGGPIGRPGRIDEPHEGPNVAATLASLALPHDLSTPDKAKPKPHPHLAGKTVPLEPAEATERVAGFARLLGADLVGFTRVDPRWVYSHVGEIFNDNWEDWGRAIDPDHEYAVVFGFEMALDMIGPAPHTPTTIESMHKYADGAYIATQVARFIANMGYSATANHLRHYEVMLVPLAVDAGLGELSRMGYLITKEYGPRIRLGAVTTNLEFESDDSVDLGIEDFCLNCKKCAEACPSRSIPMDDQILVNGTLRWKLNDESCFGYWGRTGTDCSICMRVCPWSHARTLPHRLVVSAATRNQFARRAVRVMDDVFYGRTPSQRPAPAWADYHRAPSSLEAPRLDD